MFIGLLVGMSFRLDLHLPRGAQHVPTNPFKMRDMTIRFYRAIPWCFFWDQAKAKKHAEFEGEAQVFKSNLVRNGFPPSEFNCVSVFLPEGRPSNDHLTGPRHWRLHNICFLSSHICLKWSWGNTGITPKRPSFIGKIWENHLIVMIVLWKNIS